MAEWRGISDVVSAEKRIKRRGSRTEPCETHRAIGTHLVIEFPDIIWVSSDRQDRSHHIMVSRVFLSGGFSYYEIFHIMKIQNVCEFTLN